MHLITRRTILQLFSSLTLKGFVAYSNWSCCPECGWAKIDDLIQKRQLDVTGKPIIFFTQDQWEFSFIHSDDLDHQFQLLESSLTLAWRGNGSLIQDMIESLGFVVDWDGRDFSPMYLRR